MVSLKTYVSGMAIGLGLLTALPAVADPTASEAYDQKVADYAKVQQVTFTDDKADLGGKAYEFAKATLDWFGVPGETLDAADFIRSVKNDGLNAHNATTLAAKLIASRVSSSQVESLIKKLDARQLKEVAEALHLGTAGDLQKAVLEYATETASTAAGQAAGGDSGGALTGILVDVMKKSCKTCGVAWTGYELAAEAKKAASLAFDNAGTQEMFAQMAKAGWYRYDEFSEYFTGNEGLRNEARKALTALNASQNRAPPSDADVMKYIFDRYQRWQTEIQTRGEDAELLATMKDSYLSLLSYQKEEMFGAGGEAEWAGKFMSEYMPLYKDVAAYRGDHPWPFGLGREGVRDAVFTLLKKSLRDGMNDEQVAYETRKLVADWGWIAKEDVGPPPVVATARPAEDRATIVSRIAERLPNLDKAKLDALFGRVGIKPSDKLYNCLCPNVGMGYHYYSGPDAGGPCRHIGPLGGVSWSGFDSSQWASCAAAYPLEDGRTVIDALADSVEAIRAEQKK